MTSRALQIGNRLLTAAPARELWRPVARPRLQARTRAPTLLSHSRLPLLRYLRHSRIPEAPGKLRTSVSGRNRIRERDATSQDLKHSGSASFCTLKSAASAKSRLRVSRHCGTPASMRRRTNFSSTAGSRYHSWSRTYLTVRSGCTARAARASFWAWSVSPRAMRAAI